MKDEFLVFTMLGILYGVRLEKVREILTYENSITPLPSNPAWVLGVINLRGEITPVIDLRRKFASGSCLYDAETIVVALKLEGDRMVAIVVDTIENIVQIDMKDAQHTSDIGSTLDPRYLDGLVKVGNDMVSLLNIDVLLGIDEI
ncbi:chemotaxis protein CheW [Campylobacterota bacterium]|nr:chemotaxis protein CheW [Campylobacterota bacterium]